MFYDKTSEYESRVAPLVDELKTVCSGLRLPMFLAVCIKHEKDPETGKEYTVYKKECLRAETEVLWQREKIGDMILRTCGFNVSLPAHIVDAMTELQMFLDKIELDSVKSHIQTAEEGELSPSDLYLLQELDKTLNLIQQNIESLPPNVCKAMEELQEFISEQPSEKADILPTGENFMSDISLIMEGSRVTIPKNILTEEEPEDSSEWEEDIMDKVPDNIGTDILD